MSSVGPPLSLRERRKAQTRADLVAGVIAVIEERGLDELTIDRISQASGISRGTVYAYFPGGHSELVAAAYEQLGHVIIERTTALLESADGWQAELDAHAEAMLDFAQSVHIGHFYNVSGPALITAGAARGIGSGASTLMIAETLRTAQSAGQVDATVPAEALATLLVGAIREAATAVASGGAGGAVALAAFERLVAGLSA